MASRFSKAPFYLLPAGDCDAPTSCIRYCVRGNMRGSKSWSPLGSQHLPFLAGRRMWDFTCWWCCKYSPGTWGMENEMLGWGIMEGRYWTKVQIILVFFLWSVMELFQGTAAGTKNKLPGLITSMETTGAKALEEFADNIKVGFSSMFSLARPADLEEGFSEDNPCGSLLDCFGQSAANTKCLALISNTGGLCLRPLTGILQIIWHELPGLCRYQVNLRI